MNLWWDNLQISYEEFQKKKKKGRGESGFEVFFVASVCTYGNEAPAPDT